MPIDYIRTRVVTVDTAKRFIIPMLFLFIRQQNWNDAQLRIATVTRFSWYFAAKITFSNL